MRARSGEQSWVQEGISPQDTEVDGEPGREGAPLWEVSPAPVCQLRALECPVSLASPSLLFPAPVSALLTGPTSGLSNANTHGELSWEQGSGWTPGVPRLFGQYVTVCSACVSWAFAVSLVLFRNWCYKGLITPGPHLGLPALLKTGEQKSCPALPPRSPGPANLTH